MLNNFYLVHRDKELDHIFLNKN